MRVDLKASAATAMRSSLFYGVYRSGKTHLCATFPRVAWFGSEREGGVETIKWMDPTNFYEEAYPPIPFTVNTPGELMSHLEADVMPLIRSGRIRTVVLELSFYSDDMIRARADEQTWQKYADLEKHIISLDARLKKIPGVRIVYNTLATPAEEEKKYGGVVIAGKALSKKIPALCDVIGYMRTEDRGGVIDHVLNLTSFGNFPAGHRYGNRLPPLVRNPTFRQLEALLEGRAQVDQDGRVIAKAAGVTLPVALPPIGLPPLIIK